MKMKKQLLAGVLAVGLGVGAASLPQGDVAAPTAQVGHTVLFRLALLTDRLWMQRDSVGCFPWTLDKRCRPDTPMGPARIRFPGPTV